MRCLVVADLHYALQQYDWVIEAAPAFDVVVIAGDHLDLSGFVDRRTQSVVIRKYIERLRALTQVIVCSGNHDLDARGAGGEKVTRWIQRTRAEGVTCDGDSVVIGDTLFTVCPWWDGPVLRQATADQIAADVPRRDGRRWVWVYHAPPDRSPVSWGGSRHFGDAELVRLIDLHSPDIVLSGHVHQSPFTEGGSWVDRIGETWVFNMGHQFGAPPARIVFDGEAGQALWFSAAGNQFVDLDKPLTRPVDKLQTPPDWLIKAADRVGAPPLP